MEFEFNQQLMPQSLVEVDEIGQFGLEGWNDEGYYYYIIVKTILGTTVVATCGPIVPDVNILPSGFKMSLDKMPYKEEKLIKKISIFLNDPSKCLTHARVLPIEETLEQFKELKEYLLTLDEETF